MWLQDLLNTILFIYMRILPLIIGIAIAGLAARHSFAPAWTIAGAGALSPDARALAQAQDFAARHKEEADACVVLVAGPRGPDRDGLEGVLRALARTLAPVRVNALAPARAGAALDLAQASAALAYLATARAVTGQVMEIGAPDEARPLSRPL